MKNKIEPDILFEDPNVIVVSKPAGLLSQGEHTGDENLVDWLRDYFGRQYVGLVHRLDRNTSGVMVVAKRTKAASRLTAALQEDRIIRSYLGILTGRMEGTQRWKHWLKKDEMTNTVKPVNFRRGGAKKSILSTVALRHFSVRGKELTLASFQLETGRSHQIRVQAAAEGYPLAGDIKYGPREALPLLKRPALHSHKISFPHPISGETLAFEAPLPSDMQALLEAS